MEACILPAAPRARNSGPDYSRNSGPDSRNSGPEEEGMLQVEEELLLQYIDGLEVRFHPDLHYDLICPGRGLSLGLDDGRR